jgi:hypothetical protein
MKKIYQNKWFGIEFSSIFPISSNELVNSTQYEKFYATFYSKFSGFDDLPVEWLADKQVVFQDIISNLNGAKKLLSIGSGIGYVEKLLSEYDPAIEITAIEPFDGHKNWLSSLKNINKITGFFPNAVKNTHEYDLVYLCGLDCCLDDTQYKKLLMDLKECKIKHIIFADVICVEDNFIMLLRYWIRSLLRFFKILDCEQFWGFSRSRYEHLKLFSENGLILLEEGKNNNNTFWFYLLNE